MGGNSIAVEQTMVHRQARRDHELFSGAGFFATATIGDRKQFCIIAVVEQPALDGAVCIPAMVEVPRTQRLPGQSDVTNLSVALEADAVDGEGSGHSSAPRHVGMVAKVPLAPIARKRWPEAFAGNERHHDNDGHGADQSEDVAAHLELLRDHAGGASEKDGAEEIDDGRAHAAASRSSATGGTS